MGSGGWSSSTYASYSTSMGRSLRHDGTVDMSAVRSVQEVYRQSRINEEMSPRNIIRECCDSDEHPRTKPVIAGIDITGSMGSTAMEVAKTLNPLMTEMYDKVDDVEFAVMGIGDLDYDKAPIQFSQFESDVRVAKHLDKVYFEGGGGGNSFESYTAAWYMGSRHCKLDCWKRGQKGVIITIGDEPLNPYLPKVPLGNATGDLLQGDIETPSLYREASEKFDIYHIHVNHGWGSESREDSVRKSFVKVIPEENFKVCTLDSLKDTIVEILVKRFSQSSMINEDSQKVGEGRPGYISW